MQFKILLSAYKMVDRGLIELMGPHGISQTLYRNSYALSRFQTGHLYHYTLMMIEFPLKNPKLLLRKGYLTNSPQY